MWMTYKFQNTNISRSLSVSFTRTHKDGKQTLRFNLIEFYGSHIFLLLDIFRKDKGAHTRCVCVCTCTVNSHSGSTKLQLGRSYFNGSKKKKHTTEHRNLCAKNPRDIHVTPLFWCGVVL